MKYNIGDKVVPVGKTNSSGYRNLKNSYVWNMAKKIKQKFLYVTAVNLIIITGETVPYQLSHLKDSTTGDFFNESDLKPYVEK